MASYNDHLTQVRKNLLFLEKINKLCPEHIDWQITTCFYVAVHMVDAHIASTANLHYRTHKEVEIALNPFPENSNPAQINKTAWLAYKKLRNLSRKSRYLLSDKWNDLENAGFANEKDFSKAIFNLDNLFVYFKDKYDLNISTTTLKFTSSYQNSTFAYFKGI